jgi:integrase
MLTIYRRHLKRCEHRTEGRSYRRCRCPLWADGTVGGTEVRCSIGTQDWDRAQTTIRDWEAAGRAPLPAAPAEEPMTTARVCDQYIADVEARNLSRDTLRKYKLLSRQLKEFAKEQRIPTFADFDLPAVTAFRVSWKDKNYSALKKLELLRSIFKFAVKRRWAADNLAMDVKNPEVKNRPTLPYTHEDMTEILAACNRRIARLAGEGRESAQRLRALVLLLRYSGLRIGDAVGCPVENLVDGKLRLYTQKTGTHVHCPLPDFVVMELESMPRRSERYWFSSGKCRLATAVGFWRARMAKLLGDAGVEEKTARGKPRGHAHRFRDTFAVELLLVGVPIEQVAVLLGHESVKVTQRHYAPWVRARQEQAEANVRRTWVRDPVVLMADEVAASGETKGTQEVRGKDRRVM